MNPRATFQLLFAAAAITLVGTGIQIFRDLPAAAPRALNLGLLLAFGFVVTVAIVFRENQTVSRTYLLSCTLIILTIFFINERDAGEETFTLFFILTSCAALLLPVREAMVWVVCLFLVQVTAVAVAYNWGMTLGWVSAAGGHFMFAGFGYMLRQSNLAREHTERLYAELQETHAKLQEFAAQSQQLAVAEERNRLAREMHDSLGHRLTVAILQLEGAQHLIQREPERAATMVGNMRDQLKEALAELRRALSTLRSASDTRGAKEQKEITAASLIDDIEQLVNTFQEATDLIIHTEMPADLPQLDPARRLALFRASQELLTNVQRHAVASEAWLALACTDEFVSLLVADNGRGMPEQIGDGRFGLKGLEERVGQLNGSLQVGRSSHGGAQVIFTVPFSKRVELHSVEEIMRV